MHLMTLSSQTRLSFAEYKFVSIEVSVDLST